MLDIIRSNSQSLWVKVAFGVIILVFVFWGVGSFTDTSSVNVIGTVNGEAITYPQFENAYRAAEENVNRQNPRRSWTAEEKASLGRQVFQELVTQTLIDQEAKRVGIDVSPYELRLYVGGMEIFQNSQGKFDPERYKEVLAGRRMTPAVFEADIAHRLVYEKMLAFISSGAWTDASEARNRFNFLRQKRVVEYIYLPSASEKVPAPTDERVTAYYEEHKADYAVPQKVNAEYLEVNPLALVSPESVSEEDARAYYEANRNRFEKPESLEVSHILVPLDKDAPAEEVKKAEEAIAAIQAELASGKDFAAVADAHNPPNAAGRGGRVGNVVRGATVPAFEAAAFAAEVGKVTAPVRSEFGLHLILVSDRKPASIQPFEEVEGQIRSTLAAERSRDRLSEVLDTLTENNILGRSLEESGRPFNIEVKTTGLMSRQEIETALKVSAEGASAIMSTGKGQPLDVPIAAGDRYLVVRVVDVAPATFRSLDEVRDDVVKKLADTDGLEMAMKELEGVLKESAEGLPDAWKERTRTSAPVDRGGAMAPFQPQAQLEEALFKAGRGEWLPSVFAVREAEGGASGALMARVVEVSDPSDEEWTQFEGIMANITERERVDGIYQAFMQALVSRSKIEVRNRDIIERKNM